MTHFLIKRKDSEKYFAGPGCGLVEDFKKAHVYTEESLQWTPGASHGFNEQERERVEVPLGHPQWGTTRLAAIQAEEKERAPKKKEAAAVEVEEFLVQGEISGEFYIDSYTRTPVAERATVFTDATVPKAIDPNYDNFTKKVPVPFGHPSKLARAATEFEFGEYTVQRLTPECAFRTRLTPFWVVKKQVEEQGAFFPSTDTHWLYNDLEFYDSKGVGREFNSRDEAIAALEAHIERKKAAEAAVARLAADKAALAEEGEDEEDFDSRMDEGELVAFLKELAESTKEKREKLDDENPMRKYYAGLESAYRHAMELLENDFAA